MVLNAIGMLLPKPLLRVQGPSSLVTTVTEQKSGQRNIIHLLHYIPERRGKDFDVIEDVFPVHNLKISLRADHNVKSVRTVPENESLMFNKRDGRIEFELPRLEGHQMIELVYG